jgi:translation initiation factor 5A
MLRPSYELDLASFLESPSLDSLCIIGERALSRPVDVGSLKIGQYVVIENEPCKIVEFEKSKPGKHGSAKARIVAIGVLTGQKRNVISPVDGKLEVPMIDKKTGQVISMQPDSVQIMDMQSYETFETPLPDDEEVKSKLAAGVEIEYWEMLGKKKIVRTKG